MPHFIEVKVSSGDTQRVTHYGPYGSKEQAESSLHYHGWERDESSDLYKIQRTSSYFPERLEAQFHQIPQNDDWKPIENLPYGPSSLVRQRTPGWAQGLDD